jgi:hypothetical protein
MPEANKDKYKRLLNKVKGDEKKQIETIAAGIAEKVTTQLNTSNKRLSQELRDVIATMAVEIATLNAAFGSHRESLGEFDATFNKLADSLNKDAVASLSDAQIKEMARSIGAKVAETIVTMNQQMSKVDLATQQVEVKGLDSMLNKLVDKIPDQIDGEVTLAYGKTQAASKFVNVRLTDGKQFIDSLVTAARGPGLPLISIDVGAGKVLSLPVVNPDGSYIGGTSGGSTDPKAGYFYSDAATVSNYDYIGKINKDGAWYIQRINNTTDAADYVKGDDIADYTHGSGFGTWAAALSDYATADITWS